MSADILNVDKQLVFYGAYHSNKVNVLIHVICVPLIFWSFQVLVAPFKLPYLPAFRHVINDYLVFDTNYAAFMAAVYLSYYYLLEPIAALLYTPQMILSVLSATAFCGRADYKTVALTVNVVSWIAQFIGHGLAEGRAPALLNNLVGAIFLAPFFVHLEILFALGYRPKMHERIESAIGVEIANIQRHEADRMRKAQ